MLILCDENVPDAVAEVFRAHGHEVYLARDLFLSNTPDTVVAAAADAQAAILLTWDRDFKAIAPRIPRGQRVRFRRMGRISFSCNEAHGARRANELIDWIEFEYGQVQKQADKRLLIEIGEGFYRSSR